MKSIVTPLTLFLRPKAVENLNNLQHFMADYALIQDLKQYRPQRKPITISRHNNSPALKVKRRMIVRDWFFFVIWYIRLKKLMRNFYDEKLLDNEVKTNSKKYSKLIEEKKQEGFF
jgi:hypothetical protein